MARELTDDYSDDLASVNRLIRRIAKDASVTDEWKREVITALNIAQTMITVKMAGNENGMA